jgi:hypothetical protein
MSREALILAKGAGKDVAVEAEFHLEGFIHELEGLAECGGGLPMA